MKHKRMITLLLVLAMLLGILPVTAAAADVPAAATPAQSADGWLEQSKLHGYADSSESGRGPQLAFDGDWSDSDDHHPGWHSQWNDTSTETSSKGKVTAENGRLTENNNFYIVLDKPATVDQVDIVGSWWNDAAGNGSVYTCKIYVSREAVTSNTPNIEWGEPVFDNTAGNTDGKAAFTYTSADDLRKSAKFSAAQKNVKSIKLEYVTAVANVASAWEIFVHTVTGQEPEQKPVEIANIFAESYRDDNYAKALTDGNPASSWHSKYDGGETATNHYPRVGETVSFEQTNSNPLSQYNNLYLVLKEPSDVSNVLMQAKWHDNEDTLTNGTPEGVRIYVSDAKVTSNAPTGVNWTLAFDNTSSNGFTYANSYDTVKVADFGTTQNNVRSIRIEFCTTYADSGTVTNQWMQLVEVGVNEDPYDLSLIEFYPNVLDATKNGFSDNGVWSKYYLPGANDTAKFGGFGGPKYVDGGGLKDYNVAKWQITKGNAAEPLTLSNYTGTYYPGRLVQVYDMTDLKMTMTLICADDRTALIKTEIENKSKDNLHLALTGTVPEAKAVEGTSGLVQIDTNYDVHMQHGGDLTISTDQKTYTLNCIEVVPANGTLTVYQTQTYSPDGVAKEREAEAKILTHAEQYFQWNAVRWNGYLQTIEQDAPAEAEPYKRAAVKAIITLTGNWRSASGQMNTGATQPFGDGTAGFWAWDSWKHAVATSKFNPTLAKEEIETIFQFQQTDSNSPDYGTIYDNLGRDGLWNKRDSKPPLAAWAVYNYYEQTKNLDFLREIYDKLVLYHNWWYTNRDIDHNGIAEYGAMKVEGNETNGEPDVHKVLEAVSWESGMDNAARFDSNRNGKNSPYDDTEVFKLKKGDTVVGYTLNQESVDLNSYLYAEKCWLSEIANLLGKPGEASKYLEDAEKIRDYINTNMYDPITGYYYDLKISEDGKDKKLLTARGKGPEGWIPLWAGVATPAQAKTVVEQNMLNEDIFYTTMPFPTLAKDSGEFAPNSYWRGPVWLDQAMFAVEALERYGYTTEAGVATRKLFENADGLMNGTASIRENYNPLTGAGLNNTNFSWASASFYNLFYHVIARNGKSSVQQLVDIPNNSDEILKKIEEKTVQAIKDYLESAALITRTDANEALAYQSKFEGLSDPSKQEFKDKEKEKLEKLAGRAQKLLGGEVKVLVKDQSKNKFDLDVNKTGEWNNITMEGQNGSLSLKGYFQLDSDQEKEAFNNAIGGEKSFTVDMEVTLAGADNNFNYLASKGNECFGLRTQNSNLLKFYSCGANNGWHNADATNVARGQKVQITATYDSSTKTMTLYVDGTKAAEAQNATVAANNNTPLSLGLATFNSGEHFENSHTFHSFHVFSRALSADEIKTVTAQDSATLVWYDFNTVHYSDDGETPSQVDKTALNAAIEEAKNLTEADYTAESWKPFADALKAAEDVLSKADATQDEVNAAVKALTDAKTALVKAEQPQPVDKSELQRRYNELENLPNHGYTQESWTIFTNALIHAKSVLADDNVTAGQVANALAALNNAANGLTQIAPPTPVIPVTPSEPAQLPFNPNAGSDATKFPFTDVPSDSWYYESVYYAWDADLIDGTSATTFRPDNTLTVAEAIKLAAALHQLENDGVVTLKNGTANWYDTYVAYAVKEGIIEAKYQSYTQAQMNAPATRREFVHILHGALDEYEAMNAISDNAIPDVKTGDAYADEIYDFYRAGILTGSNAQGTFHPESSIKRSEVAAILIRMYDESMRLEKTL